MCWCTKWTHTPLVLYGWTLSRTRELPPVEVSNSLMQWFINLFAVIYLTNHKVHIYQSNLYSTDIPGKASLSGATAKSVFNNIAYHWMVMQWLWSATWIDTSISTGPHTQLSSRLPAPLLKKYTTGWCQLAFLPQPTFHAWLLNHPMLCKVSTVYNCSISGHTACWNVQKKKTLGKG